MISTKKILKNQTTFNKKNVRKGLVHIMNCLYQGKLNITNFRVIKSFSITFGCLHDKEFHS